MAGAAPTGLRRQAGARSCPQDLAQPTAARTFRHRGPPDALFQESCCTPLVHGCPGDPPPRPDPVTRRSQPCGSMRRCRQRRCAGMPTLQAVSPLSSQGRLPVGRSHPDASKARQSQHALPRCDRMYVSSHAQGRLTRARTRSSPTHDAACPCPTPSVGGAGQNFVQQVRDLGSLQHAGVGQIKAIQTGGFLLCLGA